MMKAILLRVVVSRVEGKAHREPKIILLVVISSVKEGLSANDKIFSGLLRGLV